MFRGHAHYMQTSKDIAFCNYWSTVSWDIIKITALSHQNSDKKVLYYTISLRRWKSVGVSAYWQMLCSEQISILQLEGDRGR